MEMESTHRYRSRILREMKANRDNPFNSPPSSTGSHGTVSPTLSSVFSDPEGESTRKLNEDIARVTAPRKLPVNWEAAHRKWPEFYSMPKSHDLHLDDDTETRPLSAESKENKPPARSTKFVVDDTTQDIWNGSARTRAEMQPRVDNESDLSSIISKSPARGLSAPFTAKNARQPSPLSKAYTRTQSVSESHHQQRRSSLTEALEQLRASASPHNREQRRASDQHSPGSYSAKSSLTAVPPSPKFDSPGQDASQLRSFFMPDVSHLGDFVTGTLRFSGSMKNGMPVFVKHGKVHDQREKSSLAHHAEVDGLEIPEEEEKIFVSMDMIREEIMTLQDHHDKVQEYASNLQQQVESLEAQLKARSSAERRSSSERPNEQLLKQKESLEIEITTLQSRLEQASRKISLGEIEKDSLIQEKDRAVRKLQEACEDINKLTRKLSVREKDLENSRGAMETSEQERHENDTLRRDIISLKHGRDALELENTSLRAEYDALHQEKLELEEEMEVIRSENETLRRQQQSLLSENKTLRTNNQTVSTDNEELQDNLDSVQHELDAAREQVETLQVQVQEINQEKLTLREDNDSLVRHNEKYFDENKVLRRENSGFERSLHDLREENLKLKEDVEFLKQQVDHCRPIPKKDLPGQLGDEENDETEENMTSAFFIPDITMNTDDSAPAENTETKEMPDLPEITSPNTKLSTIPDATEEQTQKSVEVEETSRSKQTTSHQRSRSTNKSVRNSALSAKVAFSIPEQSTQTGKSASHVANQGSRRHSKTDKVNTVQKAPSRAAEPFTDIEDTTGIVSIGESTKDLSVPLSIKSSNKRASWGDRKYQDTQTSHTTHHTHHKSRHSQHNATNTTEMITEDFQTTENSPTLSHDARRVLDGLCEHSCRNCTVCARISSHKVVVSSRELAIGKKRVTVSRPVPVSDRNLSGDHTLRPAQAPGNALAIVIKGLEDEAHHLQLELSKVQIKYGNSDKALGRRERLSMAERIRTLLKQLEAKNDQIYSLYDVLEGQKAAGQAMSEDELEMTVLNITGMTIRDVTSGSEQLTWEGIEDQ